MTPPGSRSPTRVAAQRHEAWHLMAAYGLPALGVALFAGFSAALPDTFPTHANLSAIVSNNGVSALLALGAMIPIVLGKFDLSIGFALGFAHVVALELIVQEGWPWQAAGLVVVLLGGVVGLANGLLAEFAHIDSFIATLGTGSVLYALTGWITGGARIVPSPTGLPQGFIALYDATWLGLPVPGWYVLALTALLWTMLERLPLGRYMYVIGSNPRAARLLGIPTRRYGIYAFVGAGLVAGFAGVLLAAQQQLGNPTIGMDYLLPAFVGALLGSTTVKPGRPNALGTLFAVAILAEGLAGIGQLGAAFWATPLFNGIILLIAVAIGGSVRRRRLRSGTRAERAGSTGRGPGGRPTTTARADRPAPSPPDAPNSG
ncbi:ABC transporter permease [Streptacidiphilus rugosus]|uniref:ABC transporter permease n=1 Tax=Streptacidiphilus rugosus TaxID=405783 RepID=UPI00068E94DF|nr:ABC transporter permease [Streptacidiphilus rugosus]